MENQTGKKIKRLRTDNGLEFCNTEFDKFCAKYGIARHKTVRYTPQQNGLAERMNRTLLERVRCMLTNAGLSKAFWGEAVVTAAYLINRSPSSAIGFMTPEQKWSGSTPKYDHLRVFGCPAFVHIKQGKLEPRALKGIFIGYPEGVKGYKVWCTDLNPHKSIISRDVTFNESTLLETNSDSVLKKPEDVPSSVSESETEHHEVEHDLRPDIPIGQHFNDDAHEEQEPENFSETAPLQSSTPEAELEEYQLARDRQRRVVRPPSRYAHADLIAYAFNTAYTIEYDEPKSYAEAIESVNCVKWQQAMEEEITSLNKNHTWKLVVKPKNKRLVGCKWVYKVKEGVPGVEPTKFKARLVAQGFTQKEGVDFHEIFSPVVKHSLIRILLSMCVNLNLHLEQMDVKTAFLHGELEEELYMAQPKGFEEPGKEDYACLLKKSLYGLKQSPRQWYRRFDDFMLHCGFTRSKYDGCVYFKALNNSKRMYLLLYVDDMLIACEDMEEIHKLKNQLGGEFEMKDLGSAKRILGMDIVRGSDVIFLSQQRYILKVLDRFRMRDAKVVSTPLAMHFKLSASQSPQIEEEKLHMLKVPYASAVGSIMYAMVCTRPDIAQAVSVVSRYMANPGKEHWMAVKWILRYLKGTSHYGLLFRRVGTGDEMVKGYVDSDYAGDLDNRRSLSGYIFTVFGCSVCWKSVLQHVVALSTTEAEYIALGEAIKEAIWLKGICAELLAMDEVNTSVHCDSQSAIHLSKHQVFHERSKHIDVRMHFIRDTVQSGIISLCKIPTSENPADMLTKPLPSVKFKLCMDLTGITTYN